MWQVMIATTGIISAIAQAIGKRQVSRMSAFQSGLIRDMATWGLVIVFYLFQGEVRMEWGSVIFVVLGLFEAVSMAAYYSAQREQMAATAVFSYPFSQVLIIMASGIFFHEWQYFDPRQVQGLVNCLGVVGLVGLMAEFQKKEGLVGIKWSTKLVLSSLVIVSSNVLAKWGVGSAGYSSVEYMFWEYLGIVLGGVVFVYGRGMNLKFEKIDYGWGILQGLLFGIAALWYVGLLAVHPLSVASVIRRVVIVLMTTGFGVFGYGEGKTMSRAQIWKLIVGIVLFMVIIGVNR